MNSVCVCAVEPRSLQVIYSTFLACFVLKGSVVSAGQCVLAIFSLLFTDEVNDERNNPVKKGKVLLHWNKKCV